MICSSNVFLINNPDSQLRLKPDPNPDPEKKNIKKKFRFHSTETNGQKTDFRFHDEQTVNGIRKIAWASVFHFIFCEKLQNPPIYFNSMSPCPCSCLHVHVSMSPCVHVFMCPCLHISMCPCLYVSMSMFHVSIFPSSKVQWFRYFFRNSV